MDDDCRLLAFDLEIAKEIPEGETDWIAHRPLGISCAAITADNYGAVWHGKPQLNEWQCREIVGHLLECFEQGYRIVGWNSLSFDFLVLAEESGRSEECKFLAANHLDMMFQIFCLRGHVLGLDKAARGMRLTGKMEGMHGALAPELWTAGEYQKVLDYLSQDVQITLELAKAVEYLGFLRWRSNSGKWVRQPIAHWQTVLECLEIPQPDTSWMTDPWPRSKFTGWLGGERFEFA